jgi:hypothetical protein
MGGGLAWARRLIPLLLVCTAAACSNSTTGEAGKEPAPEEQHASATEVAAGLGQIDGIARDIAARAGTDKAAAGQLDARIEPAWQKVEGTVKSNDQDAYITFEDTFAVLGAASRDGDAAKARTASETISKAVSDYLAKYPG